MTHRLLGLGAGNPGGSAEILLKEALRAAESEGAGVELVRLDDLRLSGGPEADEPDDVDWFWERLMAADGVVVAAPILSRSVPGRLKTLMDRLLGPNADRAIVEKMLELRASGVEPAVPFRLDQRVLRPRVAGLIAVGGSLMPQWKSLALPLLHTFTFSMQTAVVDQLLVGGAGTPRSVLLDDDALKRAAELGRHVAGQLGRTFAEAEYAGPPGLCPMCHLDVMVLHGRSVTCATCGSRGRLGEDAVVEWTDLTSSVISMEEKRVHYDEILTTAQSHAQRAAEIHERGAAYELYHPVVRPDGEHTEPQEMP